MRGKILLQRVSAHPSDEQARLYYLTSDNKIWFSNGASHYQLIAADGGTYNINISGTSDVAKYVTGMENNRLVSILDFKENHPRYILTDQGGKV